MAEHRAGIVLAGLHTFLIGHAVFGCLNQILGGTNDANHRENAQRYGQITPGVPIRKRTADTMANRLGNIAAATAAMTLTLLLANASTENDGIDDFWYRDVIGK